MKLSIRCGQERREATSVKRKVALEAEKENDTEIKNVRGCLEKVCNFVASPIQNNYLGSPWPFSLLLLD